MSLKGIIERFTLVSGLEMKDVSRYLPILIDCKEYFEAHFRHELSDSETRRAEHACAVFAYQKVSMIGGLSELDSFKVGDVQIGINALGSAAAKLWAQELDSVSDILDLDGDFAFRSVTA